MKRCQYCRLKLTPGATVCQRCCKSQRRALTPDEVRQKQKRETSVATATMLLIVSGLFFLFFMYAFLGRNDGVPYHPDLKAEQEHQQYLQVKHDLEVRIHGGLASDGTYYEPPREEDK
jgi:hypothetical protein